MASKLKLILGVFFAIALAACGEYGKIYKSKDSQAKYKLAMSLYEEKNFAKAVPLFEQASGCLSQQPRQLGGRVHSHRLLLLLHERLRVRKHVFQRLHRQLFAEFANDRVCLHGFVL